MDLDLWDGFGRSKPKMDLDLWDGFGRSKPKMDLDLWDGFGRSKPKMDLDLWDGFGRSKPQAYNQRNKSCHMKTSKGSLLENVCSTMQMPASALI